MAQLLRTVVGAARPLSGSSPPQRFRNSQEAAPLHQPLHCVGGTTAQLSTAPTAPKATNLPAPLHTPAVCQLAPEHGCVCWSLQLSEGVAELRAERMTNRVSLDVHFYYTLSSPAEAQAAFEVLADSIRRCVIPRGGRGSSPHQAQGRDGALRPVRMVVFSVDLSPSGAGTGWGSPSRVQHAVPGPHHLPSSSQGAPQALVAMLWSCRARQTRGCRHSTGGWSNPRPCSLIVMVQWGLFVQGGNRLHTSPQGRSLPRNIRMTEVRGPRAGWQQGT